MLHSNYLHNIVFAHAKPNRSKHRAAALLLAFLLILTQLAGCQSQESAQSENSGNKSSTTESAQSPGAIPSAESPQTAAGYEQYEEQQLVLQTEFDEEMDELFRSEISSSLINLHYLLKDPSSRGIPGAENLYEPITLDAVDESLTQRAELSARLESFDPAQLRENQRLTQLILQSMLNTETLADGLELYAQPLEPAIGIQSQLPILLSEYIFYQKSDIDDYLSLIAGLDEYYQQILAFEQQKAEAGLMMSDTSIDHVIESCEAYLLVPGDNFLIDTFAERLETLPGLTTEEKNAYIEQHAALLESDFVPAYQLLIDGMRALKGSGSNELGQSGFPRGKEYYRYLVYAATGTSYSSVEKLLADMEDTVADCLRETSALLRANPELLQEIDNYRHSVTDPANIMEALKEFSQDEFPALPACNYALKNVPAALEHSLSPAFYLISPLDDYQNNVIYINQSSRYDSYDLFSTLAHEGYPGHLYQNVYFHTSCDSDLRRLLSFTGYAEGWATYVEQLSYTMDPALRPELGRLLAANAMATLGIHACLDIYVNYLGWTKEQVSDYLAHYFEPSDTLVDDMFYAMVDTPSNYLSYFVGCMEIQDMRRTAEKTLGDRFSALEFHTFLLDMGSAPFDVIRPYFNTWLISQQMP
ncbi:MAG: DUF885 domain-containing protein [Clostridiales bacterium]|nr:DUF885 domain-containing protein [Clostridiales bacterium]